MLLIHVHVIFMFLATLFLAYTSPVVEASVMGYEVNWCFLISSVYVIYYAVIELPGVVGPLASVMTVGCFVSANFVKENFDDPWKLGLFVHVFCWIAQFYGMLSFLCCSMLLS